MAGRSPRPSSATGLATKPPGRGAAAGTPPAGMRRPPVRRWGRATPPVSRRGVPTTWIPRTGSSPLPSAIRCRRRVMRPPSRCWCWPPIRSPRGPNRRCANMRATSGSISGRSRGPGRRAPSPAPTSRPHGSSNGPGRRGKQPGRNPRRAGSSTTPPVSRTRGREATDSDRRAARRVVGNGAFPSRGCARSPPRRWCVPSTPTSTSPSG